VSQGLAVRKWDDVAYTVVIDIPLGIGDILSDGVSCNSQVLEGVRERADRAITAIILILYPQGRSYVKLLNTSRSSDRHVVTK